MEIVGFVNFHKLAKELEVRRNTILKWCNRGLLPARQPTKKEREQIVMRDGRVFLKRVMFGPKDPRTRHEWVATFLSVITRE